MSFENLNDLSIEELKKLVKEKNEVVEKLKQENKKEKLIQVYKKLQKKEEKLRQLKPKSKLKLKSKPKPKPKSKPKSKSKHKEKSYNEYFQECIKNKTIPKDAPPYLKKALERAVKEYNNEIKLEKSALSNFAEKYVIDGKPGLTPLQFFAEKVARIKDFLRNHRNTKLRMILVSEMEQQIVENSKGKSKINFSQGITKFENQNPDLPGINVFSINDNNKIYPLRLNQKDTKKSIDLFLFSKDE